MRRVAREAGVRVVGVNISNIQLERAKRLTAEAGLGHMVDLEACSFMDMSAIDDGAFDRGYAIESTCHAPDKQRAFAEIFRVLKPGAPVLGAGNVSDGRVRPERRRHRAIKQELMRGIALKEVATFGEVNQALEAAGFQVIEGMDREVREGPSTPWYQPMESRRGTLRNALRRLPQGRRAIIAGSKLAEVVRLFPKGLRGSRPAPGSDRGRLRRGRQIGYLHAAVLLPGPQTPLVPVRAARGKTPADEAGRNLQISGNEGVARGRARAS